jgi:hypothetical protein
MKNRIIALVIGIVLLMFSYTFTYPPDTLWTRVYGGLHEDEGFEVRQTFDGGFIAAGFTTSFGSNWYDVYIIRIDQNGDSLWTRYYGGAGDDFGWAALQCSDSCFFVAGENLNVYLLKIRSDGSLIWQRIYGGIDYDGGSSIQETIDGNYVIAGWTESFGAGGYDVYLLKLDINGDTIWTRTYGGSGDDSGIVVQQTDDGGYIILANTESFGVVSRSPYLIRVDSIGDTIWTRVYEDTKGIVVADIQNAMNGEYVIVGSRKWNGIDWDVFLLKINAYGDSIWSKTYGGTEDDLGHSVKKTVDGGYIIAGRTKSYGTGGTDAYLIKVDSLGDTIWTSAFGGYCDDVASFVSEVSDGGYITVGRTKSFGSGIDDVYFIRTNPLFPFDLVSPWDSSWTSTPRPCFLWRSSFTPRGVMAYKVFIDDTERVSTIDTSWLADYNLSDGFHSWYIVAMDSFGNSKQSNQTWEIGIDANPPIIESTTVWHDTAYAGPFPTYTRVNDLNIVDTVLLYFKRMEDPVWFSMNMLVGQDDWYYEEIPQVFLSNDSVKYYIYARDMFQFESTDPQGAPDRYYLFIANMVGVKENCNKTCGFQFSVENLVKDMVTFRFLLAEKTHIRLVIYDVTGRVIAYPVNDEYRSGLYEVVFRPNSKGVFFFKLETANFKRRGKLLVF